MRFFATVLIAAVAASVHVQVADAMAASAHAEAGSVNGITIIEKGLFQAAVATANRDKSSPTGAYGKVTKFTLVEDTTTIKAQHGSNFGILFRLNGTLKDAPVSIKIVQRYPATGLHNPQTGQTTYVYEHNDSIKIGQVKFEAYSFEHPWEEVPGVWTFEVWYQDRKLAKQSFNVVK